MEEQIGKVFVNNHGAETTIEEVEKSPLVGVYCSASWCPPCRKFTEVLLEFYKTVNHDSKKLEIVLVPFDQEADHYKDYFGKMPWLSIPHHSDKIKEFIKEHHINGIPQFFIFNSKDGKLISKDGRKDISTEGEKAIDHWMKYV